MNNPDPSLFLGECETIDFSHIDIARVASQLAATNADQTIRQCFHFVRDEIKHSCDFKLNPVTCKASDVLKHRTGYCYAKSHLLCALLRANDLPTGLCYQRLSIDDNGTPFCLHGLNAVFLPDTGWYRIDPRGNRDGINARFTPPQECLAFPVKLQGEYDLPEIYTTPMKTVIAALRQYNTWDSLLLNLPDVPCDGN